MRPTADEYFMSMARLVATRGTCHRRKVGCVLVNNHNHVLSTGYNGPPSGFDHCIDSPCPGAFAQSGTALDKCQAVHAEANALLQCKNVWDIHTIYSTTAPCIHCVKLLLNTSCKRIFFAEYYPHPEAKDMWESAERKWDSLNERVPISSLDLSPRAVKALMVNGVNTIDDVKRLTNNQLLRMPNLGRKTLKEIREVIGG